MGINVFPAAVTDPYIQTSSKIFEGMLTTTTTSVASRTVSIPAGDHLALTARASTVSFSNGQSFNLAANTPTRVTLGTPVSSVSFTLPVLPGTSVLTYPAAPSVVLNGMVYYNANKSPYAYTNGVWVAIGNSTTYYTSTDGINWTTRTAAFSGTYSVQAANGLFFAWQSNGTLPITTFYTSPDAVTWTSRTLPSTYSMGNVVYASTIGRYAAFASVALEDRTNSLVLTSADGFTWAQSYSLSPSFIGEWLNMSASPTRFVACRGVNNAGSVTQDTVYSSNGTTWNIGTRGNQSNVATTVYNPANGLFYAYNNFTGGPEQSSDGSAWVNIVSPSVSQYLPRGGTAFQARIGSMQPVTHVGVSGYTLVGGSTTGIGFTTDGTTWTNIGTLAFTVGGSSGTMQANFPHVYTSDIIKASGGQNSPPFTSYLLSSGFTPASFGLYAGPTTTV